MLAGPELELLAVLDDVALLARIFTVRAGVEAEPDALLEAAIGMVERLARTPEGVEAVARARGGDLRAILALIDAPLDAAREPELVHHLALFEGMVADAMRRAGRRDSTTYGGAGSVPQHEAELRAARCWASLLAEGRYLQSLARTVADGELSEADVERATRDAALHRVHGWAERARLGVVERSADAASALLLLHIIASDERIAPECPEVASLFRSEADRGMARAVDSALAVLDDDERRAEAQGELTQRVRIMETAASLHSWAHEPWTVTLFILDRATPVAWSLYKKKRWTELKELTARLRGVIDQAAERVERDPTALAYAATTAQHLVFRAEMGGRLGEQIRDAERALALCPTHRNARLILADLLADRALSTLDRVGFGSRTSLLNDARADIERADALWQGLPRVARARARLESLGGGKSS